MHDRALPMTACFAAALSLPRYNLSGHVERSCSVTVGYHCLAAAVLKKPHARRCQPKQKQRQGLGDFNGLDTTR